MTLREALAFGASRLRDAGITDPRTDARRLLSHFADVSASTLITDPDIALSADQLRDYSDALSERSRHRPIAQIIGHREFWGRDFLVTPDTLDPRPETELIIELALRHGPAPRRILDLGTGTGCLLLTLLAEFPDATGTATDISQSALAVAQENARRLQVADRATFVLSDWFAGVAGTFDLIVSNPPYILVTEMAELAPDVRLFEPSLALTTGGDGFDAYRAIAATMGLHLDRHRGSGLFEIGASQAAAVRDIFSDAGWPSTSVFPDINGKDRVVRVTH